MGFSHARSKPPCPTFIAGFFQLFGTKEWITVLYCDNKHFTSHVVRCTYQLNGTDHIMTGHINYLDSFLVHGHARSEIFQRFLTWAGIHSKLQIYHFNWTIVQKPTGSMRRQAMYHAPGRHGDQGMHIDCGSYAFL